MPGRAVKKFQLRVGDLALQPKIVPEHGIRGAGIERRRRLRHRELPDDIEYRR